MEQRRPRLSLDELHLLRWLLGGALMLISIATVFYLDIGSEWMAALAALGVAAALAWPALPARVPIWVHRLAFPAIVVFFSVDLWYGHEILPAIVRLDLLLLLYRGISHRASRDDLQIVVLGLFLIVAGVLTVSLLFAAQILVFTACALGLLMVVTIVTSTESGQAPKLAVRGVLPLWAAHADWGRLARRLREIADWRLIASAVALFVGVVAVSGLLFLAIPRFQLENSLFLERFITRKAKTGFSDSIKFGDITEILQDDGIALDVDLSDPAQAPANPYWRMVVLDEYHDGGFRLSAAMRSFAFKNERTGASLRPLGGGARGAPTWTFYLEAGVSRYLPAIGRFDQLRFREAQNYRYSTELGIVALRDEPASMTAYRLEGMAPEMAELADPVFARKLGGRTVKGGPPGQVDLKGLSAGDQQVLSRMVSALGLSASQGTGVFARRAIDWLRRLHSYSLSPEIPEGPGDPLVRWMSSREPGHCELFAGALVLIARSAGIPARVVTGFKGGTWNAYSGNYTIRNSDAHAWAELWDPRKGAWLREDPLAASADAGASEVGAAALAGLMDRSWSAKLNSLRVFWYRRIVNFDQQTQADTFRAFKAATDGSSKWLHLEIDGLGSRIRQWVARPWDAARVARTAAGAAAVAAAAWILRAVGSRLAEMGRGRRVDPIRREAGRWLVRVAGPPKLVADLQRLRYGPVPTWPRPAEVFRAARKSGARRI